jgi:hypothetical protein
LKDWIYPKLSGNNSDLQHNRKTMNRFIENGWESVDILMLPPLPVTKERPLEGNSWYTI